MASIIDEKLKHLESSVASLTAYVHASPFKIGDEVDSSLGKGILLTVQNGVCLLKSLDNPNNFHLIALSSLKTPPEVPKQKVESIFGEGEVLSEKDGVYSVLLSKWKSQSTQPTISFKENELKFLSSSPPLPGIIVGMCNPLLDISSEVPLELFTKYGLSLNNAILAEPKHLPLYEELVQHYPVQYIAGGAGQNSMRVAQWLLQQHKGSTAYFGAVGEDEYGLTLERCATADGVTVCYQKTSALPTGTCAVLISGGERSLVANLSAANSFTADHLQTPAASALIQRAAIFYVTGFFLTVSVEAILVLARHAASANKLFALNISAPFLVQFFAEPLAAVMPYADIVFANESEAEAYGLAKGYGSDLEKIALQLCGETKVNTARPRTVVFTQGSRATLVVSEGRAEQHPVEPLSKELLVDTNGAGDAFVGGYLAQLLLNGPMVQCVRAGHFAARTVIQRSGCTFPATCDYDLKQ